MGAAETFSYLFWVVNRGPGASKDVVGVCFLCYKLHHRAIKGVKSDNWGAGKAYLLAQFRVRQTFIFLGHHWRGSSIYLLI